MFPPFGITENEVQFSQCPHGGRQGLSLPFTAAPNATNLSKTHFRMPKVILDSEGEHYLILKCTLMYFLMNSYHFFWVFCGEEFFVVVLFACGEKSVIF